MNLHKYDVIIEINNDPDSWKHVEVFATDSVHARVYAVQEMQMDGYELINVISVKKV